MTDRQIIDQSNDYYKKVELIRRPLLNYTRSKIYGAGNAEDVVQNTLLILCQKMNQFDANKSFHGWAFKICNFQIKKYLSTLKRRKEDCFANLGQFYDKQEEASVEKIILKEELTNRINNIKLYSIFTIIYIFLFSISFSQKWFVFSRHLAISNSGHFSY